MGGCRCTYKNCTVRSDGKTHLFHYPVFDKIRCHEWLSNAGRYDFLNLKVSQLKNRCICQHHFKDDFFMNNNKEKLKTKAIPTLDGPYCDSSKFKNPEMPQNMIGLYPLPCEVIETDDFMIDRKSNYNVVYADFLTNSEIVEPFNDISKNKMDTGDCKNFTDIENITPKYNNNITEIGYKLNNSNTAHAKTKFNGKSKKDGPLVAQDFVIEISSLPMEQNNANVTNIVKVEDPSLHVEQNNTNVSKTLPVHQKKKSRIRIISEKKITEPEKKISVPVSNALFEVVKPSMVLNIAKNRAKSKTNDIWPESSNAEINPSKLNNMEKSKANEIVVASNVDKVDTIMFPDMVQNSDKAKETNITQTLGTNDSNKYEINETNLAEKLTSTNEKKTTTHHTIKNKISPERVAAINEKRKFNMKLKDIIAEELNRLEGQASADRGDILIPKKNVIRKKLAPESVLSSLSKEPGLPNEHAYLIHYLEARMERMENLLLNKIDQNTQKIMTLKRSLDHQEGNPSSNKSSQKTSLSDEAHKKQLYKEISKYLTPGSKSLIYEELFINKYDPNEIKAGSVPTKRKRNR